MSGSERTTALSALATTWAAGLLEEELAVDPQETLRPVADTHDEAPLPRIPLRDDDADLELRDTLGEGGMARVERAWQRSLAREVAVKRARDAQPGYRTTMVREARVAGGLEHPNIVPVHALGRDEDGEAVIVMKRVSGVSWRALLAEPDHPLWGGGERLLRNLEILIQVCRPIELAHSRGWLHRDLKTENVMVGEFGEVYVLDWGIAVPLEIAASGEAAFAGTPAYMAPEMAAVGVLGERTDVHLLGAILHEVLTGDALNPGSTLQAVLYSALTEREREYPPETPPELAEIARRATAYHAEDRYPDVASFRRALSRYVIHRDALEIAERAAARVDAVEADEVDDPRTELVEARSGFRQSLSVWAQNARAAAGLERCLRLLVDVELRDDNPSAAMAWATQLDPPDADLERRIEAHREALEQKRRELERLRSFAADRDIQASARARRWRALVFAAFVAAVGFLGGAAHRAGWFALGYVEIAALSAVVALAALGIITVGLHRQNLASRWLAVTMLLATLTPFPVLFVLWRMEAPAIASFALDVLIKAGGAVVLGVVIDPVFRWVAVVNLATAAVLVTFPERFTLEIAAAGLAAAMLVVAAQLRRAR